MVIRIFSVIGATYNCWSSATRAVFFWCLALHTQAACHDPCPVFRSTDKIRSDPIRRHAVFSIVPVHALELDRSPGRTHRIHTPLYGDGSHPRAPSSLEEETSNDTSFSG
jgi:hypothetical protein